LPEREKRGCSFHHACDKKGSSSHVTSYSLFRRSRPGTRERLFIGDALNKRRIAPGLWTGSKGLREAIESHPHPWARRPQQVCWTHGRSRVLLCALQGRHAFAEWRRLGGFQQPGPFAPVWLPRHGLVKRLGQAGLAPLQERWETLNGRRAHPAPWAVSATVAPVAPETFARDETRLD